MFPGFDKFYSVLLGVGAEAFHADFEDEIIHRELLRGNWIPKEPLCARWSLGASEPGEIAIGRTPDWIYINTHVQSVFNRNDLTGWETYPMVLQNKSGKNCKGYAGLSITGRCGPILEDDVRVRTAPERYQMPGAKIGIYFDESSWDGSDFFCSRMDRDGIIVTEKVVQLFKEESFNVFDFTPLPETAWIP